MIHEQIIEKANNQIDQISSMLRHVKEVDLISLNRICNVLNISSDVLLSFFINSENRLYVKASYVTRGYDNTKEAPESWHSFNKHVGTVIDGTWQVCKIRFFTI